MLRVWRLDGVAFTCTCMYGMTQACASILGCIARPQAAVDFADLSLAFVHRSLLCSLPFSLSFLNSLTLTWPSDSIIPRPPHYADSPRCLLQQTS